MSFSLRKNLPLKNISKNMRKTMKPEHYKLLAARIGRSGNLIDALDQEFLPILARWSFDTNISFCTEHGIFSILEEGKTVKELLFDLGWKNETMLQDLLDTLVDQEILRKKDREYQPFAFSTLFSQRELGLRDADKRWIKQSTGYRPIFIFYNKLLSSYVLDSLNTGCPTTKLKGSAIFDSLLKTPVYVIPRMAAVAAGVAKRDPKNILDLNCSTGRGLEEIFLCQPDPEFVLGVDSNAYHVEIAKRNIGALHETHVFQDKSVEFQVIDYSSSLTDQLSEFLGIFDMILIDQLPMWIPKEARASLIQEILHLLRPDGIIALYQPFRPSPTCPWPDEWILWVLDGFCGFPDESKFLNLFKSRIVEGSTPVTMSSQAIIPILAYLLYK